MKDSDYLKKLSDYLSNALSAAESAELEAQMLDDFGFVLTLEGFAELQQQMGSTKAVIEFLAQEKNTLRKKLFKK